MLSSRSMEDSNSVAGAAWRSPSNIALIKYWGKHGDQLPRNPSLSLTLSEAYTETEVLARRESQPSIRFVFEGKEHPGFADRVEKYIERFRKTYPTLRDLSFDISSSNSFPHSTGIASSASAMSALALSLLSLAEDHDNSGNFYQEASNMARQGSGSACRSIYGPVAVWGRTEALDGSSDEYAIPVSDADELFGEYCDSILIVDSSPKSVSSSAGHALMHEHPFAERRFRQAREHLEKLLVAMRTHDLETFISITETEALSLHAMMMTSAPSYILMKPGTLGIIENLRKFRKSSGIPVCFTLDAGPNVHVLYPGSYEDEVRAWIESDLLQYTEDSTVMHDRVGKGPQKTG